MRVVRLVAAMAILAAWIGPREGESCGPFLPEAEFAPVRGPVDPAPYVRGDLGVVRPTFRYRDLFVAWRFLSSIPLTAQEAEALYPTASSQPYTAPGAAWTNARKQVPGLPPPKPIDIYRRSLDPNDFYEYPNCLDDAFDAAAKKLGLLTARWGASSPQVHDWVVTQDQVFENCSAGPAIPAPLPAGSDADLATDRNYQIAAAEFYAGRLDAAERDFRAITGNPAAPYLVARTLIRQGTLHKDPGKLRAAADQLNAIIGGAGPDEWKRAARSLLGFVRSRVEPEARLREVSADLMRPGLGLKIATTFDDFVYLWNRRAPNSPPGSDFGDWLQTISGNSPHAVERWRDTHSAPWLIAALATTSSTDAAAADLIAAAHEVKHGDPGWPSATYYGIRMQRQKGEVDAARQWADRAMALSQSDSTRNLLRAERLAMARDWDEFLRYSPRRPVAVDYGDGFPDQPFGPNTPRKSIAFDTDTVEPMNRMTPIAQWRDASASASIPPELQAGIAQAGWVRAVVLGDRDQARSFAERLAQLRPALAAGMRGYLAQTEPRAAEFTAVFLMLRNPGFSPELRAGLGRLTPLAKRDELRDNWWTLAPRAAPVSAPFLPEADRAEGRRQAEQLQSTAANSVNYLSTAVLAWAKDHPRDPRVPEALHLVVEATHYGSSADRTSSPYSKQAFDILHRQYPNSPWTRQTKYWY